MRNEPIFKWSEALGEATCTLTYNGNVFYGIALCHEKDSDMKNEKTGYEIAYRRAYIKALKFNKNCIIKPELNAYNQLYFSMNKSNKFNPNSYENKMLQRKIREKKDDLIVINETIVQEEKSLRDYLKKKEEFYQKIRKNRQKVKKSLDILDDSHNIKNSKKK